ncbi:MAG: 2-dehydropantoate 2-reductase [Candidatus Limnocylindrales bacterium]|jgi:2-dehydropantoate 2-reductase
MKIAVVGTGSLGGYFGGRLAMAGEQVYFLDRGPTLAALRASGLRVRSVFGDFALSPAETHATDDPTSVGPVQIVLFTVKSFDTDGAAATLPPLLGPDTAIVSLQNGVDNEERIARAIGPQYVVGGLAFIFAGVSEPGVIRHTGGAAKMTFGEFDGRRTPRMEALLAACEHAGISAELSGDIKVELWTKYTFICAQAGLTAATRQPIGVIRQIPQTWALFRQVLGEVVSVARAEGVRLPDDVVERQLEVVRNLDPTAYSSLYDDLVAGRRMELEALLGELVRRADRAGVPAPASSALYGILLPSATRAG